MLTSLDQECILFLSLVLDEFVVTKTKPGLTLRALSRHLRSPKPCMHSFDWTRLEQITSLVVNLFHQRSWAWSQPCPLSSLHGPTHRVQKRHDSLQMPELARATIFFASKEGKCGDPCSWSRHYPAKDRNGHLDALVGQVKTNRHQEAHQEICLHRQTFGQLQLYICAFLSGQWLLLDRNKFGTATTVHRFHMRNKNWVGKHGCQRR